MEQITRKFAYFWLAICIIFAPIKTNREHWQALAALSTDFPSVDETYQYLQLSSYLYDIHSEEDANKILPDSITVLLFEDYTVNDATMVVYDEIQRFIAVVFGGSDTLNDFLHDAEIRKVPFGPKEDPINENVGVHNGFNNVLFNKGNKTECLYDRVKSTLEEFLDENDSVDSNSYKVITTGHSLGGGLSNLMAAGLTDAWMSESSSSEKSLGKRVNSISFAPPLVADEDFKEWYESMDCSLWRHVLQNDIVARIPTEDINYVVTGHTVWFQDTEDENDGCSTYYGHYGNYSQSYASVPNSYYDRPLSIDIHGIANYLEYMETKSLIDPELYYSSSFESNQTSISKHLFGHAKLMPLSA